jgi:hypothetical protein
MFYGETRYPGYETDLWLPRYRQTFVRKKKKKKKSVKMSSSSSSIESYDINTGDIVLCCCSRDGLWRKRIFCTVRYPSGTVWWITRAKVSSDGLFQKYSAAGNNRTNFPKTWVRPADNAFREDRVNKNIRTTMTVKRYVYRFWNIISNT